MFVCLSIHPVWPSLCFQSSDRGVSSSSSSLSLLSLSLFFLLIALLCFMASFSLSVVILLYYWNFIQYCRLYHITFIYSFIHSIHSLSLFLHQSPARSVEYAADRRPIISIISKQASKQATARNILKKKRGEFSGDDLWVCIIVIAIIGVRHSFPFTYYHVVIVIIDIGSYYVYHNSNYESNYDNSQNSFEGCHLVGPT